MSKIAIFCETWKSGGIESFIYNVLINADNEINNIDIISSQLSNSVFTDELKKRGVHFVELAGSYRAFLNNYIRLRRLFVEKHYDVVYLNVCQGVTYIYADLAYRCGIKRIIVHSHNTDLRKSYFRLLKLFIHKFCVSVFESDEYEYWACSSEAAKFQFPKHAEDSRYSYVPNGICIEKFAFNPQKRKMVRECLKIDDKFVIGNVGRLCDQKNQLFILDMFGKLLQERDDAYLILVGEGEYYDKIKQKVAELGIANRVNLYGVTKNVEELMWAMDCFVFPSKFEGLGIVAIEAQAAGLTVLCSKNVPVETKITDSISYINLNCQGWVEKLSKIPIGCRYENVSELKKSVFDVKDVSKKVMKEIFLNDEEA